MIDALRETVYRTTKRAMDVVGGAVGLVLTAPVTLPTAGLIWLKMGRPILFKQTRPGQHGEPFTLLKFRTMRPTTAEEAAMSNDAMRITPLGKFLRESSIDELPSLINVLRGQMSLVGPRPLLMRYLDRYTPEQARRMDVKPGVTGWTQVNGRNDLSWEEKFAKDVWYVDHQSLWLDLKILALTVVKVLRREGVNKSGHATTTEFMGTEAAPPEATQRPQAAE